MLPDLSQEEMLRYSRHLMIPEVGLEGQRKLKAASVLIVGSGGLGSPMALYLAAAGIGHIGIVDYDVVDASNLQRQVIHGSERVGMKKVESARRRMLDINPYIQVDGYDELFTSENAERIAASYQLIVDGTDNFPTRYLINDLCVLTGKPYVYGSVFRFEGQVSVFDAQHGPCYRCLFPEPPPPGVVPSCAIAGVFGILPGTIGTIQASEAIKLILGIGTTLTGKLLLYDALDLMFQVVTLRKNPNCKICGANPQITQLIDYEAFCGAPAREQAVASVAGRDIEPRQLAERLRHGEAIQLIDLREPVEMQINCLPGAINIPYDRLRERIGELDPQRETVLYCHIGVLSIQAQRLLAEAGFRSVKNLRGGINAWSREVDPSVLRY